MPPYSAAFPKGARAQIAALPVLEEFKRTWTFHHPLQPEQLECAGRVGIVKTVGYYHGGDVLYWFEDLPGIWHETCLVEAPAPS
jgi:hypothetical protein